MSDTVLRVLPETSVWYMRRGSESQGKAFKNRSDAGAFIYLKKARFCYINDKIMTAVWKGSRDLREGQLHADKK
jgi:hypothetical protein